MSFSAPASISILIPCYNEAQTIAKVVRDFRAEMPEAEIIVLDNASTDGGADLAREAGALVILVPERGKGAVVRHIFREIDADVYIMVDGDDTYPAASVRELAAPVLAGRADMAVGDRLSGGQYERENKRAFHNFGNSAVRKLVNFCFNGQIGDVMSGYRAFSRRFVKNIPIMSDGFDVETEMTIRCLDRKLRIESVPIEYRDRPEGSVSKLSTYRDGIRVIGAIFAILKDYRPMLFFGLLSLAFFLSGVLSGLPVIIEFVNTRYVSHVPLAILATGCVIVSMGLLNCAFILDTLAAQNKLRNEIEIMRFSKDSAPKR